MLISNFYDFLLLNDGVIMIKSDDIILNINIKTLINKSV